MDYFLPLFYIFSFYEMKISSLGMIIMYLYTFIKVIFNNKKIMVPKWLLLFVLYIFITQFFIFRIYGGMNSSRIFNILSAFIMLMVLTFNLNVLNKKVFLRNYIIIATIASLLIIMQSIQINVFHESIHQVILPPFKINEEWYSSGIRPTGLFPEPQVYATYILPLIILLLENKRKKLVIFFSFAICMSTSSLGILSLVIIYLYYIFISNLNIKQKTMIFLLILLGSLLVLRLPYFQYAVDKILDTDFGNNVRLTRGIDVFMSMNIPQKLFGIGYNNLKYFLDNKYLIIIDNLTHIMKNPSYITSIYEILVYFGLFGFGIYLNMFFSFFKQKKYRILIILLFILSFAQTILFNASWLFYLIIYLNYTSKEKNWFIIIKARN